MHQARSIAVGIAGLLSMAALTVGCAATAPTGMNSPTPASRSIDPASNPTPRIEPSGAPDGPSIDRRAPAPPQNVLVGTAVGQLAPDFAIAYADGRPLTASDLRTQQKPYILYFFATW